MTPHQPLSRERLFAGQAHGGHALNRDNMLFLVIGVLTGFISGYVMHEVMAARQPAPRRAAASPGVAPSGAAAAGGTSGSQPAMEDVQRLSAHVAQNPDDAPAVRQLANLNYDIRNWDRAAELYRQYLDLMPGDLNVMTDLGAVYRYLGRPEDALEQFREVRDQAPDHWQARYNEVLVLAFDLQDFAAAGSAMAELQELQPDNPEVTRLAAELEKRSAGASG